MREVALDVEGTGLLDYTSIDYTSMPYKLKDSFKIHCVVLQDINTFEVFVLYEDPEGRSEEEIEKEVNSIVPDTDVGYKSLSVTFLNMKHIKTVLSRCTRIIAHNGIGYDFPALGLFFDIPFEVGANGLAFEHKGWIDNKDHLYDSLDNNSINLDDTLVLSKILNADKFGGHSLDNWGYYLKKAKVDIVEYTLNNLNLWLSNEEEVKFLEEISSLGKKKRDNAVKKLYFSRLTPHMIYYCIIDTILCRKVYKELKKLQGIWYWEEAYQLEKMVSDIINRQEHVGFFFDKEKALSTYEDLSEKINDIKGRVEPLLPLRKLTKKEEGGFSPPLKQVNQDSTMSATMEKWLVKVGGEVAEWENFEKGVRVIKKLKKPTILKVGGGFEVFPLKIQPIISGLPMTLKNHIDLKEYIVSLGWDPLVWAESDITVKTNKQKKTREEYLKSVKDYLAKKRKSPFLKGVLEELELASFEALVTKLKAHDLKKPLKLPTSPKYTVDDKKTLDPSLIRLGDKVEFIGDVVKYLTYSHRRGNIFSPAKNSETKKEDTGWLTESRLDIDNRIPTGADPQGTNTARMKHRRVVNIPRPSSLYGAELRDLFGVDKTKDFQIGYDASGLEARIEGHYCWLYDDEDHHYCKSLSMEKPNDLHTIRAAAKGISRDDSKVLKYSVSYGATFKRVSKQIGWPLEKAREEVDSFWEDAFPLARLKDVLTNQWTSSGKKYVIGIDGRQIQTRSKHSLINSLFQSGGVICMKVAMVWVDRELSRLGLNGNPFVEDIYSRLTTSQMIAYHDECQNRIGKEGIKFNIFNSKEEADLFASVKEEVCSDVREKDGRFFVATSQIGDLLARSVYEGGKYFDLNVDLSAAWQVGYTWKDCH